MGERGRAGRGVLLLAAGVLSMGAGPDWRNIRNGRVIPDEGYCDQPYVVVLEDGQWLLTMTTGAGHEGQSGQHIVALRSGDEGRTWSSPVELEPKTGPAASWAVPYVTGSGRVYVFYTYNDTDITDRRADMLGAYVFKYSDDGGRTWSRRHEIPIRVTEYDRDNDFGGRVQMGWGVGKPVASGGVFYLPWSKIGKYLVDQSEGWVFRSDNLLTEEDAGRIRWEMLPRGEVGLRSPRGPIAEEQHLVVLEDGSLYCVYRTTAGYPAYAVSGDGGVTWSEPRFLTYRPGGRRVKHPRACPAMERLSGGRYLLWFHNHGGRSFEDRNPVWLSGGVEVEGGIRWSEPEIVLYDPDPMVRISYPDFIEGEGGRVWFTETQKSVARVHEIDRSLLEGLWRQHGASGPIEGGRVLARESEEGVRGEARMPRLGSLAEGGGFSVEVWLELDDVGAGQVLLDSRGEDGRGLAMETVEGGAVRLWMGDGERTAEWSSDAGVLRAGVRHHVVAIVDGGPRIISFVVDGRLCDGGEARQYGWGRFDTGMGEVGGSGALRMAPLVRGRVTAVRVYDRYVRTSEAVASYRHGR